MIRGDGRKVSVARLIEGLTREGCYEKVSFSLCCCLWRGWRTIGAYCCCCCIIVCCFLLFFLKGVIPMCMWWMLYCTNDIPSKFFQTIMCGCCVVFHYFAVIVFCTMCFIRLLLLLLLSILHIIILHLQSRTFSHHPHPLTSRQTTKLFQRHPHPRHPLFLQTTPLEQHALIPIKPPSAPPPYIRIHGQCIQHQDKRGQTTVRGIHLI
mmetsp:Transcript_33453/g.70323  ORF Transcript_33453/g.70323 Transcript_33453/m.70323 type:complete len:208 (-) Transcript_33453:235-858(-)